MNTRFIAVMGCPRGGTSLVAGMLHVMGVFMGAHLIGAHPRFNPLGHFEDRCFHSLHRRILGEWRTLGWIGEQARAEYLQAVQAHRRMPLWGLKDPVLAAVWPIISGFFPEDKRIVCVHRNLLDVAESNAVHAGMTYTRALDRATDRQLAMLVTARNFRGPVLHIGYERILNAPDISAHRLAAFVGDGITPSPLFDVEAAHRLVNPALRHYR